MFVPLMLIHGGGNRCPFERGDEKEIQRLLLSLRLLPVTRAITS